MPGRRQQRTTRLGLRWLAGALSAGLAATAGAAILASAAPAGAAPTPNPSYHPGADPAQFTVTGVVDGNCTVSTGGTEVWIKPGDKINFSSSLVGVNLPVVQNLLGVLGGKLVGLNVTATVDKGTTHAQTFKVAGGKTTVYSNAAGLPGGNHTLTWTATSVAALSPAGPVNLPFTSGTLKSGAKLTWKGTIRVTNDTAQCKIAVATPGVGVSVGPVKVSVPPVNVNVPVPNLPKLPGLPGAGGKTTPGGHKSTAAGGFHYKPPPLTVPEQAMSRVGNGGGAGGNGGVVPDGGSASQLGSNLPQVPISGGKNDAQSTNAAGQPHKKIITTLASNKAPAAQMPVLLAIIAIIALSLVTATYARLYMLRRNT